MAEAAVGIVLPGPYETGSRGRAYTDKVRPGTGREGALGYVLVACPGKTIPGPAPHWLCEIPKPTRTLVRHWPDPTTK